MTRSKNTIVTLLAAAGVATVLAGGLLAGSGIAVAQIVDDPPGSVISDAGHPRGGGPAPCSLAVCPRRSGGGSRAGGSRLCLSSRTGRTPPQSRAPPPLMADAA